MKSTEFIREDNNFSEDELQRYAKLINKDCKPYLNAIGNVNNFEMYRGIKRVTDVFSQRSVRLDQRNPTHSFDELHDYINKYFYNTFGAEFRNAMFCSGSLQEVAQYGDAFLVFPIGDFKFLWSPVVDDMFEEWQDFEIVEDSDDLKEFVRTRIVNNYTNKNIKKAIDSKHEIMIRCKSYYAVNVSLAWKLNRYII